MARTQAPRSAGKKVPKQKAVRERAENDYVDPERGDSFSDSGLAGKSVRESDNETREEKRQRTMAEAEREDGQ